MSMENQAFLIGDTSSFMVVFPFAIGNFSRESSISTSSKTSAAHTDKHIMAGQPTLANALPPEVRPY